ncbi:MAG: GGDEF domain-containing protein [Deltaproteobacteria bacterium]|nr:GGDEF domain-containing protein [Deltaproteobacteria bacterium]
MSVDETIVSSLEDLNLEDESSTEPYLIVVAGKDIGKLYNISANELIAGRSTDCSIWIEDTTISRKHFKILHQGKDYEIRDLNSTNGTYVNNKRIKTTILKAGDKIQISKDTIMQFDFFDEDRKVSERKRYEMGVMDPVTSTYNKSFFLKRISDEFSFSSRQKLPLSLLMFDIDFFKVINDTYGHLAGDKVLQDLGTCVSKMIRNEDVFCRYGGEEFVIIMRNTKCQDAVNLAERIREKIEATEIDYEDAKIKVTISLGVATSFNNNYRDYVALISEVDKLLYQSKGAGRNRVTAACAPQES